MLAVLPLPLVGRGWGWGSREWRTTAHPRRASRVDLPHKGRVNAAFALAPRYTSFTFFSGSSRTGLPVAAWIAFITAGATTQMVGSPTPPQKS
jgi:hypothetical protein